MPVTALRLDLPAGFLEGFAQGGLEQAFGGLQVPGGLVQHLAAVGLFLDQQEAALVLDDDRYGDMGVPGSWMSPRYGKGLDKKKPRA